MTYHQENPQAFPHSGTMDCSEGMTLRDYFAGQALNEANREIWANHKYEDVAGRAYGIADAMLEERAK